MAYMAHEQQAAMNAVRAALPVASIVDARADVYSLGALLYEALGGQTPYLPGESPPLYRCNPAVSLGLSDILAKCLAYHARDRYASAGELAADLRRHLSDLPLRGVANRSWRERWQKWRRRKPHALKLGLALLVMLGAIATAGIVSWQNVVGQQQQEHQRLRQAEADLDRGGYWMKMGDYSRAQDTFARGLRRIPEWSDAEELKQELKAKLRLAQRHDLAGRLHDLAEAIRFHYGTDILSYRARLQLAAKCAAVWKTRRQLLEHVGAGLPREFGTTLKLDMLDVAVIWSDLHVRLAEDDLGPDRKNSRQLEEARRDALKVLEEADKLLGSSAAVEGQRQLMAEQMGDTALVIRAALRLDELKPQTSWDYCLLGRSLMRARKWVLAEAALHRAIDLNPHDFWPHFYLGVCAYERKLYAHAVQAFGICIALEKKHPAACYFNRALAEAQLKQSDRALHDFREAIKGGADQAAVHYNMALVYQEQLHDRKAALASLKKVLELNSGYRDAEAMYKRLKQ
jgi:tetratricopeptide (TPR) repeat protein